MKLRSCGVSINILPAAANDVKSNDKSKYILGTPNDAHYLLHVSPLVKADTDLLQMLRLMTKESVAFNLLMDLEGHTDGPSDAEPKRLSTPLDSPETSFIIRNGPKCFQIAIYRSRLPK